MIKNIPINSQPLFGYSAPFMLGRMFRGNNREGA
jgi:hypothetical protein